MKVKVQQNFESRAVTGAAGSRYIISRNVSCDNDVMMCQLQISEQIIDKKFTSAM